MLQGKADTTRRSGWPKRKLQNVTDPHYDYIVIGAGSAGCVVASRLSEDPKVRVLLVEAGGPGRDPLLRVPLMAGALLRGRRHNWSYVTEPIPGLGERRCKWPRGKVLGGSSAINGMVHVRGLPSDYDAWAQTGLSGWSFDDVLPYFRRSEDFESGADELHGAGGPLPVTRREKPSSPLFETFVAAGQQAGFPTTDDFNGPAPEGFGRYHFNIRGGRRVSAADAYLTVQADRPNLDIWPRTQAARILFDGCRATGVELIRSGQRITVTANREIILSGGTVNSPQLLMLSGVGDGEHLRRHGIPVVAERKEIGRNLQDHAVVRVQYSAVGINTLARLMRVDRAVLAVVRAMLFGTGPASTFPLEAGAYLKSDPALDEPDLQSHFLPGLSTAALNWNPLRPTNAEDGFFANIYAMRPVSRGQIRLAGKDPLVAPSIQPNYFSDPDDIARPRRGVRLLRHIFSQVAFDRCRGHEIGPGPEVTSDEEIDAWIRETADAVFHPVGTCRMGADVDAVVDGELRLRGVEGVRVVDASVMPRITSTNTHAPTVMIAEKAADMIRQPR
ncbi:MAG: choline dehydrogenase [Rhodospirillaceae bacterium]|nr:choline dehydrogenase [Rhodospirillaceae bacterium]